jgi:hypothetical protein
MGLTRFEYHTEFSTQHLGFITQGLGLEGRM